MLKKILGALVAVVALFLVFAGTRPDTYHVERSLVVKAPVDVAFSEVNNFEKFAGWNPWAKMDPTTQVTLGEKKEGVGATYAWTGEKMGKGRMEIIESKPNEMVKETLEFIEPFASKGTVTLTVAAEGDGSKVTWAMDGENNFPSKIMQIFSSMDAMMGKDFESGLATLGEMAATDAAAKAAADAAAKAAADAAAAAPADAVPTAPVEAGKPG